MTFDDLSGEFLRLEHATNCKPLLLDVNGKPLHSVSLTSETLFRKAPGSALAPHAEKARGLAISATGIVTAKGPENPAWARTFSEAAVPNYETADGERVYLFANTLMARGSAKIGEHLFKGFNGASDLIEVPPTSGRWIVPLAGNLRRLPLPIAVALADAIEAGSIA